MMAGSGLELHHSICRVITRAAFAVCSHRCDFIISRDKLLAPTICIEALTSDQDVISPKINVFTRYFGDKTAIFLHNCTFYCNKNTKFVENFAQFMNLSYICGLIA